MEECHILKVKKVHPDAVDLYQANKGEDVAYDVTAIDDGKIETYVDLQGFIKVLYVEYRTGWAIEPSVGFHTELFPRSSVSKTDLMLANSVGLVDEGFRNELLFRYNVINVNEKVAFLNESPYKPLEKIIRDNFKIYKKGDRIGQIVLRKTYHFKIQEADELKDSKRGQGGWGSSGR